MKISRQMRIVIVAVVVLVVGGLGAKMFLLKSAAPVSLVVPPAVHHAVHHAAAASGHHAAPKIKLDPNLPSALRHALLQHGVVAVLYAPNTPGDAAAVEAARAGAKSAHVGFAALDVSNDAVATAVALELPPGSSDPSVAVVRRPGDVTLILNGYVDSDVVTQAAREAGA